MKCPERHLELANLGIDTLTPHFPGPNKPQEVPVDVKHMKKQLELEYGGQLASKSTEP